MACHEGGGGGGGDEGNVLWDTKVCSPFCFGLPPVRRRISSHDSLPSLKNSALLSYAVGILVCLGLKNMVACGVRKAYGSRSGGRGDPGPETHAQHVSGEILLLNKHLLTCSLTCLLTETHVQRASRVNTATFLRSRSESTSQFSALALNKPSSSSSFLLLRSTAELVFYIWVARSRSESSSFTASALNKPSSSSSSSGPVRPSAALRDSVLCLPTDIHSLFVNKLLLLLLLLRLAGMLSDMPADRDASSTRIAKFCGYLHVLFSPSLASQSGPARVPRMSEHAYQARVHVLFPPAGLLYVACKRRVDNTCVGGGRGAGCCLGVGG